MREVIHYIGAKGLFFDTHAHLYDERFKEEGETPSSVLNRASTAGIKRILIPSDSTASSILSMEYVKEYDKTSGIDLYCSIGIHPHEAKEFTEETEKFLRTNLENRKEKKIQAIGEIGLDYYYDLSPRDIQKEVYRKQLLLSYEYDIPFILHERDAAGDSMDILREFYQKGNLRTNPGVCHCCSCSAEIAAELVKMGFYLGFDGPITFKNNKKTPEVCLNTPIDRIVIETDSPYLTPAPNRGQRNEPEFVPFVAEKIVEIKGLTIEEIMNITYDNGNRLYEIEG